MKGLAASLQPARRRWDWSTRSGQRWYTRIGANSGF